jgi:hypothetical protein
VGLASAWRIIPIKRAQSFDPSVFKDELHHYGRLGLFWESDVLDSCLASFNTTNTDLGRGEIQGRRYKEGRKGEEMEKGRVYFGCGGGREGRMVMG